MSLPSSEHLVRTYPSAILSARHAREFVAAELRRADATDTAVDDLGLIVSELVANAVQHGDGGNIDVSLDTLSGDCFAVAVSSGVSTSRPPMDPARWAVAPADQRSGRGLGIVRHLADETEIDLVSGRLRITCRRRR